MTSWRTRAMIKSVPFFMTASTMVDLLGWELDEDELLEVIQDLDGAVGTYEFTRRIYNYTRDILVEDNELPEEGD